MDISPAKNIDTSVVIYEFGCRVDKECETAVWDQIKQSRLLYNNLVATIRGTVDQLRAFTMTCAGEEAKQLNSDIEGLTARFLEAKEANDESAMKDIASARGLIWRDLASKLKAVSKERRAEIQERFLSKIGKNSQCETYQVRCRSVADGLGWGTANAVLDAALIAFKKSFSLGRTPRFACGEEKDQDCLTLQFTTAGGVAAETFMAGRHGELLIAAPKDGPGRRRYGEFKFRLGPAKNALYATGTWQYHRPFPTGCTIGLARLIRRRIGKDYRYALQFMVKLPEPLKATTEERKPLVSIHFGWSHDINGRRLAALADDSDPGAATLLRLPPYIEEGLDRSSAFQSMRDEARDQAVIRMKAEIVLPEDAESALVEEWSGFKRLPPQYVSSNRAHRLYRRLRDSEIDIPEWLETWRKTDRLRWQAQAHLAHSARSARKTFYRQIALDLAKKYATIAIEPLALKEAAQNVDQLTGEKTEFSRNARSGRVVAAIYELESALRWAATKQGCAILEVSGKTARVCSVCGGPVHDDHDDRQVMHCNQCGAEIDRKLNAAAVVYQTVSEQLEDHVSAYWMSAISDIRTRQSAAQQKRSKLIEGRALARAKRIITQEGDVTKQE